MIRPSKGTLDRPMIQQSPLF